MRAKVPEVAFGLTRTAPLVISRAIPVFAGVSETTDSLTVAVGMLAAVMLVTAGRKPIRRLLLGLPIGMLLHLVWDGAFAATKVFWWPFAGSWGDNEVPSLERGWLNVVMELAGAAMLAWVWRTFGLTQAERRRQFLRRGTLTPV